jgi:hypothetical protein
LTMGSMRPQRARMGTQLRGPHSSAETSARYTRRHEGLGRDIGRSVNCIHRSLLSFVLHD